VSCTQRRRTRSELHDVLLLRTKRNIQEINYVLRRGGKRPVELREGITTGGRKNKCHGVGGKFSEVGKHG